MAALDRICSSAYACATARLRGNRDGSNFVSLVLAYCWSLALWAARKFVLVFALQKLHSNYAFGLFSLTNFRTCGSHLGGTGKIKIRIN
ncbi:MAG: hypothetical protein LBR41_00920, partial [Rickettsiales bacterium]|nr:hypothetical protein [Rickettsiales bacterium]